MKKQFLILLIVLLAAACNKQTSVSPTPQPSTQTTKPLTQEEKIKNISEQSGFHINVPTYIPEGYELKIDEIKPSKDLVRLRLEKLGGGNSINIFEQPKTSTAVYKDLYKKPSDVILDNNQRAPEQIAINAQNGYIAYMGDSAPSQNIWQAQLFLEFDDVYINIVSMVGRGQTELVKSELIKIAESLK